eukprot:6177333-Pleurochrysis_carterae.AAC.1
MYLLQPRAKLADAHLLAHMKEQPAKPRRAAVQHARRQLVGQTSSVQPWKLTLRAERGHEGGMKGRKR